MASLTLALVVICAFGLYRESTRWIGLLALAFLVVRYPMFFITLLLIAGGVYVFNTFISRRN